MKGVVAVVIGLASACSLDYNRLRVSSDGSADSATETETAPRTGWECLGNLTPPTAMVKPEVQLTLTVGDLIHPEVSVSDAVVLRACRKLDEHCTMPIGSTIHPDAGGHASFTVPDGFDGYIEVNPAIDPPVYFPALIFISQPVVDDLMYTPTALISISDLPDLAQQTGSTSMDPRLGAIVFQAADCNRMPASGIEGMLDQVNPETRRFFFVGGLPTQNSKVTDASGIGGFLNVPIGVRSLSGTRPADNLYIGTVFALVRPSAFSYLTLAPNP